MLYFQNDYSVGAHPKVLAALTAANAGPKPAYGADTVCENAKSRIRAEIGMDADIHFIASGTLANLTMIASVLRPHEAVIAPESGHIATHETGAVEATGHKIISVPSEDGKLSVAAMITAYEANTMPPHMAKPGLVYISNATETGRVYKRSELQALSEACRERNLLLMMDGARMAVALASEQSDLDLKTIAELTDMFWFGGTKTGALFGEAVIFPNPALARDFAYHVKQRGALLSKTWTIGAQIAALFTDGLHQHLAAHANQMAQKLSDGLVGKGYALADPTESNQVFPVLPNRLIAELEKTVAFHVWEAVDEDHSVIRLVTSWATREAEVEELLTQI